MLPDFLLQRKFRHFDDTIDRDSETITGWSEATEVDTYDEANLVCSDLTLSDNYHSPCIDLDMPCILVDSRSSGHSHLYINQTMTKSDYFKLLKTMMEVGLVQKGFYEASVERGYTACRKPTHMGMLRSSYKAFEPSFIVEPNTDRIFRLEEPPSLSETFPVIALTEEDE